MKSKYDIIDLIKLILAFMVVAIHAQLFPKILYPWLRLAVPMFFIISSFILFEKIKNNENNRKSILYKYITRLLKYYMIWYIILLPLTIYQKRIWFENGIIIGIISLIIKPFVGPNHILWFCASLIIGVLIVNWLTKRVSKLILIPTFMLLYILCCMASGYSQLFPHVAKIKTIFYPQCSFVIASVYVYIGYLIANKEDNMNMKNKIILLIVFASLLWIEWFSLFKIFNIYKRECYLMILPLSIVAFISIKDIKISIKCSVIMRQLSSFIYPSHALIISITKKLTDILGFTGNMRCIFRFGVTIVTCSLLFLLIKKFEKRLSILRYLY